MIFDILLYYVRTNNCNIIIKITCLWCKIDFIGLFLCLDIIISTSYDKISSLHGRFKVLTTHSLSTSSPLDFCDPSDQVSQRLAILEAHYRLTAESEHTISNLRVDHFVILQANFNLLNFNLV